MTEEQLALDIIKQASIGELGQFSLSLSGLEPLICEEILRHLPGKRLTFKGKWNDTYVLVKLFFSKKDYLRENKGLELLHQNNIPGPNKLWSFIDREAHMVATEFFDDAENLGVRCKNKICENSISQAIEVIGKMHRVGLIQEDLHLDNFLFSNGEIKVLDGASIKSFDTLKADLMKENLALFLAQFPPQLDEAITPLLSSYGNPSLDLVKLKKYTIKKRLWRVRKYQKKSLRSCTEFLAEKSWHRFMVMRRDCDSTELRNLLDQPDANIGRGALLKNGNTSTVVKVAGSKDNNWVLKRYNIKSWQHGISRGFRPSRAWQSWKSAHALVVLGVPTPKPIALRENRKGHLRQEAYLITECISGDSLDKWLLKRPGHEVPPWLDKAVLNIFESFVNYRISHGDMKESNFIVHEETLMVIDLDGMHLHRDDKIFRHAFRKDIKRFLANWHGNTFRHFSALLEPISARVGLDIQIRGN